MSETDDFTHVQRRLSAVIAKSEWTSSRMRMQKSGDELRERRAKKRRSANQFLQELLERRTDSDLIDDHGAVDRYHKFVKYKSSFNDDKSNTHDELDRRLRALQRQRQETPSKADQTTIHSVLETAYQRDNNRFNDEFLSHDEHESDQNEFIVPEVFAKQPVKPSRVLPQITTVPSTSTPNDTVEDLLNAVFTQDDVDNDTSLQELSEVQSIAQNVTVTLTNNNKSSSSLEQILTSTINPPIRSTLVRPKARRVDGTEVVAAPSTLSTRLSQISSKVLPWTSSAFPRSLTSRSKTNSSAPPKRQLPSLPTVQPSEPHYDTNQLYHLLDHLDSDSSSSSLLSTNFTTILDQLTLTNISAQQFSQSTSEKLSLEDLTSVDQETTNDKFGEPIFPDLFDHPSSSQEERFYTKLTISLADPTSVSLYTMTLSTVQLTASICLPYSILNGRRPLLKSSKQTNFKRIRSTRVNHTYQVTAIESPSNQQTLQQNDIILQINDQSVWRLTTDAIIDLFKQYRKRSSTCSLTIARLCQPFVEISSI